MRCNARAFFAHFQLYFDLEKNVKVMDSVVKDSVGQDLDLTNQIMAAHNQQLKQTRTATILD